MHNSLVTTFQAVVNNASEMEGIIEDLLIDEKFKPEDCLNVAAEAEIDLKDVDGGLSQGYSLAS